MPAEGFDEPAGELGLAQRGLLALIGAYQVLFAPMYAGSCRFLPSCSAYAAEAIRRFGAVSGTRLAAGRLLRCRPFGGHGLDPVPAFAPSGLRRGKQDSSEPPGHPSSELQQGAPRGSH